MVKWKRRKFACIVVNSAISRNSYLMQLPKTAWNMILIVSSNGSIIEGATRNADLGVLDNKKTKRENSLSFLNSNAKRSFSCPKNFSENIIPGERLVLDSANDINHAEFNPDPCHGKKANQFTREDVARTGIQKCIDGFHRDSEGITVKPKVNVKPDGKLKDSEKMFEVELGGSEDNALTSVAAKMFDYHPMNLE